MYSCHKNIYEKIIYYINLYFPIVVRIMFDQLKTQNTEKSLNSR